MSHEINDNENNNSRVVFVTLLLNYLLYIPQRPSSSRNLHVFGQGPFHTQAILNGRPDLHIHVLWGRHQ